MNRMWWAQIKAIIRLEMKKTFFAKRGLWIYLLALAPVALFLGHSLVELRTRGIRHHVVEKTSRPLTQDDLLAIRPGIPRDQVLARLGAPAGSSSTTRQVRANAHSIRTIHVETLRYSDGTHDLSVHLQDGIVDGVGNTSSPTLGEDSYIFAGFFQFFYLRLAIFFGCLGIFVNLFRGEMVDKSLHFYLLSPIRREILLVGKYASGLLASIVIFTVSIILQLISLLLQYDSNTIDTFLYQNHGIAQIGAYVAATVLACIGYGSIFLAAGLLFRNPMFPAAVVLIWEAANPLLPALLKKFSIIYYLRSLCPVSIPVDPGMPPLLVLLVSNIDPISSYIAVFGLLAVSAIVLFVASARVRHLEINYVAD